MPSISERVEDVGCVTQPELLEGLGGVECAAGTSVVARVEQLNGRIV